MPACDWGRPCTCSGCRERAQSRATKICSDCCTRENPHLLIFYMSSSTDRKGISGYDGHYRCPECDVKNTQALVLEREEKRIRDEKRTNDRKLTTATFFKHVRELEEHQSSDTNNSLNLSLRPIKFLYNKLGLRAQLHYKGVFAGIPFNIVKRNRRYYCRQYLIENIDVNLFNEYMRLNRY